MVERGVVGFVAVLAGCASLLASAPAGGVALSKVEVGHLEMGIVLGRPGVKVRLTLQSGQAVEFRTDEPAEAAATIRMADIFLSGRARMFAELEGNTVQSLQVAGPAYRAGR